MISISELSALITHDTSDYSYFDSEKLKLFNLPKYIKKISQTNLLERGSNSDLDATVVQKKTKASKREAPHIDVFSAKRNNMKFFEITKKTVVLSDRIIEKRSEKRCRLERHFDYDSKELIQPYFKKITVKYSNLNYFKFNKRNFTVPEGIILVVIFKTVKFLYTKVNIINV